MGVARLTAGGKRRLIRGEGFASRVSGTVRPQDPGGGAKPVVAPRLMKTENISDTTKLLKGGGVSSGSLQNLGDQGWGHFTTGVSM